MRENSVDFADLDAVPGEVERIYYQRLSYQAAYTKIGKPTPSPSRSGTRYAKVLLYLASNDLRSKFDEAVAQLRNAYDQEMTRLPFPSSPFGDDDSWINWDLAKQLYFFFGTDRSETSAQYRLANPLVDERLRDEIVSRHIGWEFWLSHNSRPRPTSADIQDLLGCANSKGDGQPASWALAKLGAILRSQVRL